MWTESLWGVIWSYEPVAIQIFKLVNIFIAIIAIILIIIISITSIYLRVAVHWYTTMLLELLVYNCNINEKIQFIKIFIAMKSSMKATQKNWELNGAKK